MDDTSNRPMISIRLTPGEFASIHYGMNEAAIPDHDAETAQNFVAARSAVNELAQKYDLVTLV